MFINHPVLNRFSPSIKEIEPQVGDDTLTIPNRFSLVGLPPEPIYVASIGGGNIQESSFLLSAQLNVANAVAQNVTVGQLRQGFWRIQFHVAYVSNFLGTDVNGDMRMQLSNLAVAREIGVLYSVVGAQQMDREIEVMISSTHQLNFFLNANGVGQSHNAFLSLQCNRLL